MRVMVVMNAREVLRNNALSVSHPCTCAGQRATQLSIFATLQRRRTLPSLVFITSLALEAARGNGSRGQLKTRGGLARVAGTALHAIGELSKHWALDLCYLSR